MEGTLPYIAPTMHKQLCMTLEVLRAVVFILFLKYSYHRENTIQDLYIDLMIKSV